MANFVYLYRSPVTAYYITHNTLNSVSYRQQILFSFRAPVVSQWAKTTITKTLCENIVACYWWSPFHDISKVDFFTVQRNLILFIQLSASSQTTRTPLHITITLKNTIDKNLRPLRHTPIQVGARVQEVSVATWNIWVFAIWSKGQTFILT